MTAEDDAYYAQQELYNALDRIATLEDKNQQLNKESSFHLKRRLELEKENKRLREKYMDCFESLKDSEAAYQQLREKIETEVDIIESSWFCWHELVGVVKRLRALLEETND